VLTCIYTVYLVELIKTGEIKYAGKTKEFKRRVRDERKDAFDETQDAYNYLLSKGIRKHGVENLRWIPFIQFEAEETPENEAKCFAIERDMIFYFQTNRCSTSYSSTGWNMTDGGEGFSKEESLRAIAAREQGKPELCEAHGIPYIPAMEHRYAYGPWDSFKIESPYRFYAPFTWLEVFKRQNPEDYKGPGFSICIHDIGLPPNDGTRYRIIVNKDGEFVWTNKKDHQGELHEPQGWKSINQVKMSCLKCRRTIVGIPNFERHYKACIRPPKPKKLSPVHIQVSCIHCRKPVNLCNLVQFHGDKCPEKKNPQTKAFLSLFD
jgi:hypothetical protein